MTVFRNVTVDTIGGTAATAFGRLRTAEPSYVFDSAFHMDLQPLLFEPLTDANTTITHDTTQRAAILTMNGAAAGSVVELRSRDRFTYQAGRGQLAIQTFAFGASTPPGVTKFVGYGDDDDGVILEWDGTEAAITLYSSTGRGDETVAQSSWNIDTLDGSGGAGNPSGLTHDFTKTTIWVTSFQWLGVGAVTLAVSIGGAIYPVHRFSHAGIQTVPYWKTGSHPLRWGMSFLDSGGTAYTSMSAICCSVASEGGTEDLPGYDFSHSTSGTAGNNARAHIASWRPRSTFNSLTNNARVKIIPTGVDFLVTGNNAIVAELVLGQAITGDSWSAVNSTYSAVETSAGTISGDPGIVIATYYLPASAQVKSSIAETVAARYPITLDWNANAPRALGTISVIATGISATSTMRAALQWREIR